jgi:hypothetical protein
LAKITIVPHDKGAEKHFHVTHPFHLLFGRDFEVVQHRNHWGKERLLEVSRLAGNATDWAPI